MSTTATQNGVDELAGSQQLSAADRCDSCGAQAYIRVVVNSGELLFCAHHAHAYEDKLKATAVDWVDETASLQA